LSALPSNATIVVMIGIFGALFTMISLVGALLTAPAWSELQEEDFEAVSAVEVPGDCVPPSLEP
jgi:hypothetical protein